MTIASFDALCTGCCDILGVPVPHLEADAQGVRAFWVAVRGERITLLDTQQDPAAPAAVLLADLGEIPEHAELGVWHTLLAANALRPAAGRPRFSRNPHTGRALLHWLCPLAAMETVEVCRRISALAAFASAWNQSAGMDAASMEPLLTVLLPSSAALESDQNEEDAAAFRALYREVCSLLGQAAPAEPAPGRGLRGMSFPVQSGELGFTVAYSPRECPGHAIVRLPVGPASGPHALENARALMDANFALLANPQGAAFGCDRAADTLLLQCAQPLTGGDAQALLLRIAALGRVFRQPEAVRAVPPEFAIHA